MTISFKTCFTSHALTEPPTDWDPTERESPPSYAHAVGELNSQASQSSNSGCEGASPWRPKSSLVLTSPVPKQRSQSRLTVTRAVRGFCGSTSQRARASRSPTFVVKLLVKTAGIAGVTTL